MEVKNGSKSWQTLQDVGLWLRFLFVFEIWLFLKLFPVYICNIISVFCFCFFFFCCCCFIFGHGACGDLSSWTAGLLTCILCIRRKIPNHWTTGEVLAVFKCRELGFFFKWFVQYLGLSHVDTTLSQNFQCICSENFHSNMNFMPAYIV